MLSYMHFPIQPTFIAAPPSGRLQDYYYVKLPSVLLADSWKRVVAYGTNTAISPQSANLQFIFLILVSVLFNFMFMKGYKSLFYSYADVFKLWMKDHVGFNSSWNIFFKSLRIETR